MLDTKVVHEYLISSKASRFPLVVLKPDVRDLFVPSQSLPDAKAVAEHVILRGACDQRGGQQANGQSAVPSTRENLSCPSPTRKRAFRCGTNSISSPGCTALLQSGGKPSSLVRLPRRCFSRASMFGGLVVTDARQPPSQKSGGGRCPEHNRRWLASLTETCCACPPTCGRRVRLVLDAREGGGPFATCQEVQARESKAPDKWHLPPSDERTACRRSRGKDAVRSRTPVQNPPSKPRTTALPAASPGFARAHLVERISVREQKEARAGMYIRLAPLAARLTLGEATPAAMAWRSRARDARPKPAPRDIWRAYIKNTSLIE